MQSTCNVNVAMIGMAQPSPKQLRSEPLGAADLSTYSVQKFAGFLSLLHGLLDFSATEGGGGSTTRTAERNVATPLAQASSAKNAAVKQKEQKSSDATEDLSAGLRSAASQTVAVPLVLMQTAESNVSMRGGGSDVAAAVSSLAIVSKQGAVAPPNSLATPLLLVSMPAGGGSPSLNSSRDLAFALRLTGQSQASMPSGSSDAYKPADLSLDSTKPAVQLASDELPVGTQTHMPAVSEQGEKLLSQSAPAMSTAAADSTLEPASGLHFSDPQFGSSGNLGALTMESFSTGANSSSRISPSPKGPRALSIYGVSTGGFAGKLSQVQTTPMETWIDAEIEAGNKSDDVTSPLALVAAKSSAEEGQVASDRAPLPSLVEAESGPRSAEPDSPAQVGQPGLGQYTTDATPGVAPAAKPRITGNDSDGTETRSAGQEAVQRALSSGSYEKGPESALDQKLLPSHTNHDRPSLLAEGVLLPQPSERQDVSDTRTKLNTQPPQAEPLAQDNIQAPVIRPSQPLREVSLHLAVGTSAATANVDVQLAERAGKVQVAVRTGDQDLAKSLQGNLGELVGRLEEKGFKTEAWVPTAAQHGGSALREVSTSSASQDHSDRSGGQGAQPDSRRQQQFDQRRQGRWEAEWEQTEFNEEPLNSE